MTTLLIPEASATMPVIALAAMHYIGYTAERFEKHPRLHRIDQTYYATWRCLFTQPNFRHCLTLH